MTETSVQVDIEYDMHKTNEGELRVDYLDRAKGCFAGLAVGDALGDAARDAENQFMYGITMDFPDRFAGSTDDTEFALLSAEILLRSQGKPNREVVMRTWRDHVLTEDRLERGGASEREAASNIRRGLAAPLSGKYNAYSVSDGAAMRAAPAGIVAAGDPDLAATLAATDAEISHDGDGISAAEAVAAAVAIAVAGGDVDDVFHEGMRRAPDGSWLQHNFRQVLAIVDAHERNLHAAWMDLHRALRSEYKAAAPEAVASAFAVFLLCGDDFRRCLVYACNFGRDSDTVGAIAGALAGARCGIAAVPEQWVSSVRRPSGTCLRFTADLDIIDVARRLSDLRS